MADAAGGRHRRGHRHRRAHRRPHPGGRPDRPGRPRATPRGVRRHHDERATAAVTDPPTPSPTPSPSLSFSASADPAAAPTRALRWRHARAAPSTSTANRNWPAAPTRRRSTSRRSATRGISFWCSTATSSYLQWNVAGSNRFEAVGGIDDNTQNAFGAVVEFLFYDQDGHQLVPKAVEASVGHAQAIKIDLTGVVSFRMTCSGRDAKTSKQPSTYAAFGDPIVVHA
ncbi:NPCBM/NEW2 domain-containing protein [Dactylosporangium sp. NBC_01737]|uniref:NPCBM/NEW2 domain-containing protein n=1 Tax=Dactylosporangium sp. NBC_01737 TaxID=2975959 RepID=UPI002E0D4C81|nr:NPCBM/NEW2 domain-containing protein [Dactylosporangium sp. NBC_01737]